MNIQSGSWYQADTEIYFTTTVLLWKESVSGGRLFKIFELSLWFSYLQENQHFSFCKNACVCSSSFRTTWSLWGLSCQPFPDYLVLCHGFQVVISNKLSARRALLAYLCSHGKAAWHRACGAPGASNFKTRPRFSGLVFQPYLGWRDMSRMEKNLWKLIHIIVRFSCL